MKTLLKVVVALVVVFAVTVVGLFLARNTIAAGVIRTAASAVLGVPVEVERVRISLSGTAELERFDIGNPAGYKQPHLMTVQALKVALGEVSTSKLVVDEVRLDNLDVFFIAKDGSSNVQDVCNNLTSKEGGAASSSSQSVEILVKKVVLTNLNAHVSLSNEEKAGGPVATVPVIELTNVSTKGGMEDISKQLSGKIFEITMQATLDAVGSKLPAAIADGVGKSLEGAGVVIGETVKAVGDAAGKVVEGVGNTLDEATKGIGDLFGGDKK